MLRRFFGALFLAVLLVAGIAYAAGPAPRTIASGAGDLIIALCDTVWVDDAFAVNDSVSFDGELMFVSGTFPSMIEMKFPDADVTYSFWDYTNPAGVDTTGAWTRMTGRHDNSDTLATLYAGDILRSDERARFVTIHRSGVTAGIVNRWF